MFSVLLNRCYSAKCKNLKYEREIFITDLTTKITQKTETTRQAIYVQRHIEEHSQKHFCSGGAKGVNITSGGGGVVFLDFRLSPCSECCMLSSG